jgi:hyperosmotically inducible protein
MKPTRLSFAIVSLLTASLGTTAYARSAQQTPPQQTMPQQTMPQQMPAPASTMSTSDQSQANQSMSGDSSSSEIEMKIKRELKSHGVSASSITVQYANGTATLSGTVGSQRDMKKAKSAALRVKGVKHVDTSGLQAHAPGDQR